MQTETINENKIDNGASKGDAPIIEPKVIEKKYFHLGKEVKIGSLKVTIKLVDKFSMLPTDPGAKYIKDEVTKKIGSTWKAGTRDILRGLTPDEEKKYLPSMLGVRLDSEQWNPKVLDHWANFTVSVPTDENGLELEIGFKVVDESQNLAEPINLKNYMEYNFAKQHSQVAATDEQIDNKFTYTYYIVDRSKDDKAREESYDIRKRASKLFNRFVDTDSEKNKIDWILETKGGQKGTGIRVDNLSPKQKEIELEKIKDRNPSLFVEIAEDENLAVKAFIYRAASVGIINMEGNSYFYGSQVLGSNEKETIAYLKNQNNQQTKLAIQEKVKAIRV